MAEIPPDIQARRTVEDEAILLGAERLDLEARLVANTERTRSLLGNALLAGVPLDHFARMAHVSRQTLYRWREVTAKGPSR